MNRFLKMFAVAAAGFAVAWLAPAQTWAACPGSVSFGSCLNACGGMNTAPGATAWGGSFWIPGAGNDLVGPGDQTPGFGTDAGSLGVFPVPISPTGGESWLTDFVTTDVSLGYLCFGWDWSSFGSDGCADPATTTPMAAVVRDNLGNFAIMQVRSDGGTNYDFVRAPRAIVMAAVSSEIEKGAASSNPQVGDNLWGQEATSFFGVGPSTEGTSGAADRAPLRGGAREAALKAGFATAWPAG
jgi:hypothetical protein